MAEKKTRYRYFILRDDDFLLEELNKLLKRGWIPVRETPMGAGGDTSRAYSLVVLKKESSSTKTQ